MLEILPTPVHFRPARNGYPVHSRGPNIEAGFVDFADRHKYAIHTSLIYLPICWWNLAWINAKANRRNNFLPDEALQRYLDTVLRPDRRYFTISQCDDGIYERLPPNVFVFSAGGNGDEPVPLLCDPRTPMGCEREAIACFAGNIECGGPESGVVGRSSWDPNGAGARIRRKMRDAIGTRPGWDIRTQTGTTFRRVQEFRHMLCASTFALCPRGYGKTSFRLYEALQLGSIPVYIYDEPWLPYQDQLDWSEFSVLVPESELPNLVEIVESKPAEWIAHAQRRIAELTPRYFLLDGACRQIARMVSEKSGWSR